MELNTIIYEEMKKNNNIIKTSQVIDLGFSKTLLSNYVKAGILERIRHGTYILCDDIHDDMYTLMLRSEKIVFSHDTSAFLNNLSDRTPFTHSVTLPTGTSLPNSIKDECKCYYIKPELYDLGLVTKQTTFGNIVRTYDEERTICDVLRSRSRLDDETVIPIIKNYAQSQNKDLNRLFKYAKAFKVDKKIKTYMEVLL